MVAVARAGHNEAMTDGRSGPVQRPQTNPGRWTSFVAPVVATGHKTRLLCEQDGSRHRVRVEHDNHTLLVHISDEDDRRAGPGHSRMVDCAKRHPAQRSHCRPHCALRHLWLGRPRQLTWPRGNERSAQAYGRRHIRAWPGVGRCMLFIAATSGRPASSVAAVRHPGVVSTAVSDIAAAAGVA